MPAPHAQALASILAITRREWQVAEPAADAQRQLRDSHAEARPRLRRRDQLARRAARAFEAQVMALRCRQAFVA